MRALDLRLQAAYLFDQAADHWPESVAAILSSLNRVARRAALGLERLGSYAGNDSGDHIVSVSTASTAANHPDQKPPSAIAPLPNSGIDPLFKAVVKATEEAIVNALVAARTMTGIDGHTIYAVPHDRLRRLLKYDRRLQ